MRVCVWLGAPELTGLRSGVQNIGKKEKEKREKEEKEREKALKEAEPKVKKKSRFTTGSGLAGIRGFV